MFLRDLTSGLVPIFVLGLCLTLYVFYASSHVFLEVLIITSPSSKSRFASYWTTKQLLANPLVQFGCVGHQTPKSKVNGPRVHFPYNGISEDIDTKVKTNPNWSVKPSSDEMVQVEELLDLLARIDIHGVECTQNFISC